MTKGVPQREETSRAELAEFQPAALELQTRPPSPIGRSISIAIIGLFVVGVTWASVGDIDIVAIATGKVIPSERVKVIQPLEAGTISAIHVEDGDTVRENQILITLDTTETQATLSSIQQELHSQQEVARRLRYLICRVEEGTCPRPKVSATHEALLQQQVAEYQARLRELDTQRIQNRALKKTARALLKKQNRTLPILAERLASYEELMNSNLAARHEYLAVKQQLIEVEQDLLAQQARVEELTATEQSIDDTQRTLKAETLATTWRQLQESERQIAAMQQEYIKATQRDTRQLLTAPIDGTVQELAETITLGGVVTRAQELMKIVPTTSSLEVRVSVLNKDIGFVREGQRAAIKLDAFPFTKYGLIEGTVTTISEDARIDEAQGLVYTAKVAMAKDHMDINGRTVQLAPGMRATVEVKMGTRKVIEFFLAPLLRYKQESIRER